MRAAAIALWARVSPGLHELASDAGGLIGLALLVYGVSLIYVPAAFILAGVALTGMSVLFSPRFTRN